MATNLTPFGDSNPTADAWGYDLLDGRIRMATYGSQVYVLIRDGLPNGPVTVSAADFNADGTVTLRPVDRWWTWADAEAGARWDFNRHRTS